MFFDISVLYYLYEERAASSFQQQALSFLDDREMSRFNQFKSVKAAEQFLLGRLLAKTALSERLKIDPRECLIDISENGKPMLSGVSGIGFSIAHCEGAVMVATANTDLGIDVEQVQRFRKKNIISDHFFSNALIDNIKLLSSQANKEKHLLSENSIAAMYWTAIEAVVKLEDTSIFTERKKFALFMDENKNYQQGRDISLVTWKVNRKLAASIAVNNSDKRPLRISYKNFLTNESSELKPLASTTEQLLLSTEN